MGLETRIRGDHAHPSNLGMLCAKGAALGEAGGAEGRLLFPEIKGKRVTWDKAIERVARGLADTIERHGPDSVGFYVSGQLLTEDQYVANKLMKGYVGSANIDANSRLGMASAIGAHARAFGEDVAACNYDDIDTADLIVLVGSNAAWCHPVIHQRMVEARAARGLKIVVIDPRRTETCAEADLHLALRPGSDVALFNGLLAHCHAQKVVDPAYLAAHVSVPDGFWEALADCSPERTARLCDLREADLRIFFNLFATNPRTVTLFSQGINQSIRGTDQANAIINLHLATGRIGKQGMGPFSITGQSNAMGGREVGALASTLAAHRDFSADNLADVQRFWSSPRIAAKPGLKAVDLFRAARDGRIKALWIMAANPAASLPDSAMVREALATCPLVILSDCAAESDTARFARIKLPTLAWGERDGTVTNSERRISRQRGFLPRPGEARPDWWIMSKVAGAMGWGEGFAYRHPADIFREHARLSTYRNEGRRAFDIGHLSALSNRAYDGLEPQSWCDRPFADGRFFTSDRRARMVAVVQRNLETPPARWPLTLNTGRYRDYWQSISRTALSTPLSRHHHEPLVEVHPGEAQSLGLVDGALARVTTPQGESLFRVAFSDVQRRGEIFTPIHWTDRQSSGGRTGLIVRPSVDPLSGQPAFKQCPARIEPFTADWHGFLVCRSLPDRIAAAYSARIRVRDGWLLEMAGTRDPEALIASLLPKGERLESRDPAHGVRRVIVLEPDRLAAALYLTRSGSLPSRDWVLAQLGDRTASPAELLVGGPAPPCPDS